MQTPERAPDDDDFDAVLRELAQPPEPGAQFARELDAVSTHPLQAELREGTYAACEPRPGDVLDGRYRVHGVLGRGGMGVVLEAEHLRAHKSVAIKWMSAKGSSERTPAQIARFLREARAVANIQHPNVVDLYDVGDDEGTPFLVLERLAGESLRARIARGPLPWEDLEPIIMGVLRGVGAVHRAGIVHRDLKPDNIFLARDEDTLVPKVLDFGVAAMRATSDDGLNSLTNTGAVLGTPSYMALEQLTGGEVDARADIYALGVVMYEALTGRLPFEARSAPELAVLLVTRVPAPPSRWAAGIDRRLDAILLRALSREAHARQASVAELMRELEALRGPAAWAPRQKLPVAVGLTLLLAGGGSTLLLQRDESADTAQQPSVAPAARLGAEVKAPAPLDVPEQLQSVDAALITPLEPQPLESPPRTETPKRPRPISSAPTTEAPKTQTAVEPAAVVPARARDGTKIQLDDF